MIWFKLVGGAFVVFAGGSIGFMMASRCAARPDQLRQILSAVATLKSYMNYASAPLADGLDQCADGAGEAVARFFRSAAASLRADYTLSPREAVERAIKDCGACLALEKADLEALILFGCNLGAMDKKEQQSHLTMIEKRLEILEREAAALRDRNSKMYRYLGICGALTVVLLLI